MKERIAEGLTLCRYGEIHPALSWFVAISISQGIHASSLGHTPWHPTHPPAFPIYRLQRGLQPAVPPTHTTPHTTAHTNFGSHTARAIKTTGPVLLSVLGRARRHPGQVRMIIFSCLRSTRGERRTTRKGGGRYADREWLPFPAFRRFIAASLTPFPVFFVNCLNWLSRHSSASSTHHSSTPRRGEIPPRLFDDSRQSTHAIHPPDWT